MSFSASAREKLEKQIKSSEGLRLNAYLDTRGVLTVGYGHNCEASPVPEVKQPADAITQERADELFSRDLATVIASVQFALPWVGGMESARQAVLFDMAYNLGLDGLLGFKSALMAVRQGRYSDAAHGMLDSLWALQVKGRAKRLSRQMETGVWI